MWRGVFPWLFPWLAIPPPASGSLTEQPVDSIKSSVSFLALWNACSVVRPWRSSFADESSSESRAKSTFSLLAGLGVEEGLKPRLRLGVRLGVVGRTERKILSLSEPVRPVWIGLSREDPSSRVLRRSSSRERRLSRESETSSTPRGMDPVSPPLWLLTERDSALDGSVEGKRRPVPPMSWLCGGEPGSGGGVAGSDCHPAPPRIVCESRREAGARVQLPELLLIEP